MSVYTITICVLFSYFQYQVVLDLILLGYAYLTEISPALNTCQYVLLLSFNITVLERNLTTQYPIVDISVVLMEPYSHICTRDSILLQIISRKTLWMPSKFYLGVVLLVNLIMFQLFNVPKTGQYMQSTIFW